MRLGVVLRPSWGALATSWTVSSHLGGSAGCRDVASGRPAKVSGRGVVKPPLGAIKGGLTKGGQAY